MGTYNNYYQLEIEFKLTAGSSAFATAAAAATAICECGRTQHQQYHLFRGITNWPRRGCYSINSPAICETCVVGGPGAGVW